MKKTVHSRSKSRWLVSGILGLGSVALAATGFSVWVVSNSIVETEGDIGINYVDTAENNSVQLNATIADDESLTITETYTEDDYKGSGKRYVTNAEDTEHPLDLSVTISEISVTAGSSWLNQNTVSGLQVSIAAWTKSDDTDATTTGTDLIHSRDGEDLTYIELDTDTTKLSFVNDDFTTTGNTGTYTVSGDWTVKFKWGSFFNYESPCTYYNTVLNDNSVDPTTQNLDYITQELNTMHDNLTDTVITLKIELLSETSGN